MNLAAGHKLALSTGQWRRIHHEVHGQCWLVYTHNRQANRVFTVGNGEADTDFIKPRNNHDIASLGIFHRHALQSLKPKYLIDFTLANLLIAVHHSHHLTGLDAAVAHASHAQATGIAGISSAESCSCSGALGSPLGGSTCVSMVSS